MSQPPFDAGGVSVSDRARPAFCAQRAMLDAYPMKVRKVAQKGMKPPYAYRPLQTAAIAFCRPRETKWSPRKGHQYIASEFTENNEAR